MGDIPDIGKLANALDAFKGLLAKAQTQVLDESLREKLGLLAAKMSQSQSEMLTSYPKAMAGMEQRMAAAEKQAQATLEQAEQLRKQAEEAEKLRNAPVPPPVEPALDPALGQKLRIELLERFGDSQKPKKEVTPQNVSRSEFYEMLRKSGVIK